MNPPSAKSLPRLDRLLLHVGAGLVPAKERGDWLRGWRAELWHRRHPRSGRKQSAVDLYPGLLCDSLCIQTHMWRQALTGTASLCLIMLMAGLLCSLLPLLLCAGSLVALLGLMGHRSLYFLCEAPLVTVVGFATFSRAVRYEASWAAQWRMQPQVFQVTKVLLALLIAFSCSQDAAELLYAAHRLVAEIVQSQTFVLLSLLALRWSFQDQEHRCKHCLRSLAAPSRVGRPSWNFLDSNGTELICREGHGLLSIPELETSWRRSSRWIAT